MFSMFVVALATFKSRCYFFIYLLCKKYRSNNSKRTYLTYIFETVISCIGLGDEMLPQTRRCFRSATSSMGVW